MRWIGVAGVVCALLAETERWPSALMQDDPVRAEQELPGDARDALDAAWERWQPATLDVQAACLDGAPPVGRVDADFDGDTMPDVALAVATPVGVRLVVLLKRSGMYELHDLDTLGSSTGAGSLAVTARGAPFRSPTTGLTDYYSNPSLTVVTCEALATYTWAGSGFRKISADRGSEFPGSRTGTQPR